MKSTKEMLETIQRDVSTIVSEVPPELREKFLVEYIARKCSVLMPSKELFPEGTAMSIYCKEYWLEVIELSKNPIAHWASSVKYLKGTKV